MLVQLLCMVQFKYNSGPSTKLFIFEAMPLKHNVNLMSQFRLLILIYAYKLFTIILCYSKAGMSYSHASGSMKNFEFMIHDY